MMWTGYLVNHVTLWMPTQVLHIVINLDKMFEDGTGAAGAFYGEAG